MDTTKQIRAENVKFLVETKFSGNKSQFAKRIKSTAQHISKVLRALDDDADQLKSTAKKYVGDDMAKRIEEEFGLEPGSLSVALLAEKNAMQNVIVAKFGNDISSRPFIKWDDINSYISGRDVEHRLLNLPARMSERAFVCRLPEHIGTSISQLASPGDLVAIEPEFKKTNLITNSYIIASIHNQLSCWRVKRIGSDLLLIDEDYPERPYDGDWELIGQIKFSIKGL
ncbi:hypothetical protein [Dickeya solani]|uniref:Peptidase S24/S26A/S26B/S26C domain-containing protein n=1 Tax=Dickeya solani TaxID=1089444 RepID=A0ABU4EH50_9GAMM|nr:hypothetical protein [Dickeya solani]MCZ0823882.1 hypothetical protein [Dickeya solani]MDV6995590.1 hypothetical protein [Dickeya solani]MDV7002869.1 hypothetical protein [Dickeya solani]MDV7036645.1 hypothetical protein [Dickeya solani]MDV7043398.1 hypothetical protein [Dickeya solani]